MTQLLQLFRELLDIILASPDPHAALQRAKVAAETDGLNAAADAFLEKLP